MKRQALGASLFWILLASSALAQVTLTPDNGGTGSDGTFSPTANATLDTDMQAVYNFVLFNIPAGVTVNVTGSQPITIKVIGSVTIDGTLDCSGLAGAQSTNNVPGGLGGNGGPGGGAGGVGGCDPQNPFNGTGTAGGGASPGQPGQDAPTAGSFTDPVGGGGGGGNATAGQAGGLPNSGALPPPGVTPSGAGGLAVAVVRAGSGGGGGGCDVDSLANFAQNDGGGGGGGGGGLLCLTSSLDITVSSTGAILVNGGAGGTSAGNGGGGGGGSGGLLVLVAPAVVVAGSLSALGGSGGPATQTNCGCSPGGAGGDGQIEIYGVASGPGLALSLPVPMVHDHALLVLANSPNTAIIVTVPLGSSYFGALALTLGPSIPVIPGGTLDLNLLDALFGLTFPINQLSPLVTGLSGSGTGAVNLTFSGVSLPLFHASVYLQVMSFNSAGLTGISGTQLIKFKL